jgi:sigma-E factor negative regulatory protein RseC
VIEEDARVLSIETGFAWVETTRRSSCSSCSASSGCGTSVVSKLFGERTNRLRVVDDIGVRAGDRVVIGISSSAVTRASLLAYLLPLAALMLGAYAAQVAGAGDEIVALIGIVGLSLGLLVTGRLTGGAASKARYRPVLLHKLGPRGIRVSGPNPVGLTSGSGVSE